MTTTPDTTLTSPWRKSIRSTGGNDCVEVATALAAVHVRDSKNVRGPRLAVTPAAWAGFVSYAVLKAVRGKSREVHPLLWVVSLLFVLYFAIHPLRDWLT